MVQVNRTHKQVSTSVQNALLTACVLAGGLMLAGCGDSPTAEANKTALNNSDKAARLTASAGDVRPSEALSQRVDELSGGAGERSAGVKKIESEISKLKEKSDPKAYAVYMQQKSVADDLKAANQLVQEALRGNPENDQIKGMLQAQAANLANQQAQLKLTALETQLRLMADKAADLNSYCQRVTALGQEAARIEAKKNAAPKDLAKSLQDAQTEAEKAKTTVAEKNKTLATIQAEIDSKSAAARKIYDQASVDQRAADQAKGVESIEAFKKAMELKGQADQISMEVAQLQPSLKEAQSELQLAQIQQREAEEAVRIIAATKTSVENVTQTSTEQAAALRKQVQILLEDAKTGLLVQAVEFNELAKEIDKDVEDALKNAEAAAKSYGESVASYKNYRNKVMKPTDGEAPTGPIAQAVSDVQPEALLQLFQATARYRVGQAHMLSYSAASLQDVVSQGVTKAYKAASSPREAPAAGGEKIKTAKDAAQKAFQEVVSKAKSTTSMSLIKDTSPVKWLGFTLEAVAHQGLYILTNESAEKDAAATAAREAMKRNPSLALNSFVSP